MKNWILRIHYRRFLLSFGGVSFLFLIPLSTPAKPVTHCAAEQHIDSVINAKTKKSEGIKNWTATCSIMDDGRIIASRRLVLPYPATRTDAFAAIDKFLDEEQYRILEDAGYKTKRKEE